MHQLKQSVHTHTSKNVNKDRTLKEKRHKRALHLNKQCLHL